MDKMKNWHHITKIILLVSIYCFGICVSAKSLPYVSILTNEKNSKKESYLTVASKVFHFHNQQPKNTFPSITEYSILDFKLFYSGFWLNHKLIDLLLHSEFKQYSNSLKTILIRQKKSNLIFPFHNFW
ncbi:MAG: hypothetical protein R2816_05755 [Flavobacteriaceae bacterium]